MLSYDADGNVLTRQTRKGDTLTFTYDTLNRLSTKAAPSESTVTYAYDRVGRPIGVTDTSAAIASAATSASYTTSYSYDPLNRMIAASWTPAAAQTAPTASSVSFTHAYDANNRRIGQAANDNSWLLYPAGAGSTAYTANNLNQYTAVGTASPAYDGDGNLTSDGTLTYGYDAESRLLSIKQGATTLGAYAYDAQGRRKSKTAGGATTIFVTDADNREVLEYDGTSGALQRWYAYGPGPNAVLNQMNVAAGTRATLIPDIQGSVIGSLDSGGTLTKIGYQPFGEHPGLTSGGFRYTGQRQDPETAGSTSQPSGLYYYRSRMYSPGWGRFLQADTAGYAGGLNLYAYVANDPSNLVDPDGFQACAAVGSRVGASCLEASSFTFSWVNITPAPDENQKVLDNIHRIDVAAPPEKSYAVNSIATAAGDFYTLNPASGTPQNSAETTGLVLNGADYGGAFGEAHPHPFLGYSPDVGPEDPAAAFQLGEPVYTSAPGTVTVTGMVGGQLYTQYIQGSVDDATRVQGILNKVQGLIDSGRLGAHGGAIPYSLQPTPGTPK